MKTTNKPLLNTVYIPRHINHAFIALVCLMAVILALFSPIGYGAIIAVGLTLKELRK